MKKKEETRTKGNQNVNNGRMLRRGMKAGAALATLAVVLGIGSVSASAEQTTPSDGWVREDTSEGVVWYYYKDGEKQTGWLKDGINWYYLNEDGSMKADECFTDTDGNLYYFRSWGAMQYNNWYTDKDGNRYYFRNWGAAHNTGWNRLDGEWYYFDTETAVARTNCMEFIDNNLYAFDESGKMLHDQWGEYDGAPCYFRSWGAAWDAGWHVIDGKTYYFYFHQCMTDAWIGGRYLDATGALVEDAEINYDLEAVPAVLVSWSDGWTKMSSDPAVVETWKQKISALPVVEKSDAEDAYTGLGFTVTIREEDNARTVYHYDYNSQALTDGATCYSLAQEALDEWFAQMPGSKILVKDTAYTG